MYGTVTVTATEVITGVITSVLVTVAVLVMIIPLGTPILTVTGKVMVTDWLAVIARPVTKVGGAPVVPAFGGVKMTGPATVNPAGRLSMTALFVAATPPLLLIAIVYVIRWPGDGFASLTDLEMLRIGSAS